MDLQAAFHWIYVIAMAIGALYFISLGNNPRGVPKYEYLVATFIPIWSGLAYMAMALGQGKVEVAGQVTHYARYIDWTITTPLLLLEILLVSGFPLSTIFITIFFDLVMIIIGLIGALVKSRYKWGKTYTSLSFHTSTY